MLCLNGLNNLSPKKKKVEETYTMTGEEIQREFFELRHGRSEPVIVGSQSTIQRNTTSVRAHLNVPEQALDSCIKIDRWR